MQGRAEGPSVAVTTPRKCRVRSDRVRQDRKGCERRIVMEIERLTDGQAHKRLKACMRKTWKRVRAKCSDILVALAEMKERIESSVRIRNLVWLLETRGRYDLIACAYNGVRFA